MEVWDILPSDMRAAGKNRPMVASRLGLSGAIGPAQGVRARRHDGIRQRDAESAFQLFGQGLETAERVRDVAQGLLDYAEPDFPLTTDIPATRTARGRGYLVPSTATRRR